MTYAACSMSRQLTATREARRVATAGPISLTVIAIPGCTVTKPYHGSFPCPENPGERERLAARMGAADLSSALAPSPGLW